MKVYKLKIDPAIPTSDWYALGRAKADAWELERINGTLGERLKGYKDKKKKDVTKELVVLD